jgi:hypothetical protein
MLPVHSKRLTSIVEMCEIVGHQRTFAIPIYWDRRLGDEDKVPVRVECRLSDGEVFDFERSLYHDSLL